MYPQKWGYYSKLKIKMKNILILMIAFLGLAFSTQAQTKVLKNSVITVGGQRQDTIIKNGVFSKSFYVQDFCANAAFQVNTLKTRGTQGQKFTSALQGSFDNVTWVGIDSVSVTSASTATVKSRLPIKTVNYPYIRVRTAAKDSTQTIKVSYNILIEKK